MNDSPKATTRTYTVYGRNGTKAVVECEPHELRRETEALIRQLRGIDQVTARTAHNPDASVNRGLWWESPGPAPLRDRSAPPRRVGPDDGRTTG